MRARGLIAIAVAAGLVHVYAEYSLRPRLAGPAAALALGALAAYAMLTKRPWPVTAVAYAFAVAVLLPVFWYERPQEFGWMSYAPIDPARLPDDVRAGMLYAIEAELNRFRWMGLAILAAAVLLAVAASRYHAPSSERSSRIMAATAAVAVLMIGVQAYTIWEIADREFGETLKWAWPALLAALVFFGAAVLAGDAVGAIAGTLLGMWTLAFADGLVRQVPALDMYRVPGDVFLEPGVQYSTSVQWSLSDPWAAAYGIVLLLGIGLLAVATPLRQPAVDRVAG
jgi:hypothetical protein